MTELRETLREIVKEVGVADIIIEYKEDIEQYEAGMSDVNFIMHMAGIGINAFDSVYDTYVSHGRDMIETLLYYCSPIYFVDEIIYLLDDN